jgi:quinol-cytochrome oxidoreductase complex cytochrome b subunit
MARFVGLLYGPIDRQLRIDLALKRALSYRLPPHVGWRHALGGVTYLLLIVLIVTGVLLSLYYRPSAQEAYPSIQHVVSEVSFGWLVRDLHVWSASLIVIAALAHMGRVLFEAAYKPPRETNWVVGLLLLLVVLAFGATGYLLPWDQWAYWTVSEVLETMAALPVVGGLLAGALTGDVVVSGATLSRYFALHVIVLPWFVFALLILHYTLLRQHGVAPATSPPPEGRVEGIPFFPHHLLRSFMVAVIVLAVAISLAALFPRPIGEPANPYEPPGELVSTWVVVDVSLALIRYLGPWGLALFTVLGVSLALLPLFDRGPERRLRRRPVVAALGVVFFVGFIVAWIVGSQLRSESPTVRPQPSEIDDRAVPSQGLPMRDPGPTPQLPQPDRTRRDVR